MFVSVFFAAYVQIPLKELGEQRILVDSLVRGIILYPTHLESLVAKVFVYKSALRCCMRQVSRHFSCRPRLCLLNGGDFLSWFGCLPAPFYGSQMELPGSQDSE